MNTSQQTTSPLDTVREELDERVEAVADVEKLAPSLSGVRPRERNESKGDRGGAVIQPARDHVAFVYPTWPTSQPGPQATLPLPGQHPHPKRTDQMVYQYYDQERGLPGVPPPPPFIPKWQRQGTASPKIDLREHAIEAEALERWLDDGGVL
jgi:hypothetical protein